MSISVARPSLCSPHARATSARRPVARSVAVRALAERSEPNQAPAQLLLQPYALALFQEKAAYVQVKNEPVLSKKFDFHRASWASMFVGLGAALVIVLGQPAGAQASVEPGVLTWNFRVTTDGTSNSGARKSRDEYVTWTAPEGYFLSKPSFTVVYNSKIGSENSVEIDEPKNVRTDEGVLTGVTIKAHARSRGGVRHRGERGSTTGVATMEMKKLSD